MLLLRSSREPERASVIIIVYTRPGQTTAYWPHTARHQYMWGLRWQQRIKCKNSLFGIQTCPLKIAVLRGAGYKYVCRFVSSVEFYRLHYKARCRVTCVFVGVRTSVQWRLHYSGWLRSLWSFKDDKLFSEVFIYYLIIFWLPTIPIQNFVVSCSFWLPKTEPWVRPKTKLKRNCQYQFRPKMKLDRNWQICGFGGRKQNSVGF